MLYNVIQDYRCSCFSGILLLPKQFIAERGYEALQCSVYWIRKVDFFNVET